MSYKILVCDQDEDEHVHFNLSLAQLRSFAYRLAAVPAPAGWLEVCGGQKDWVGGFFSASA